MQGCCQSNRRQLWGNLNYETCPNFWVVNSVSICIERIITATKESTFSYLTVFRSAIKRSCETFMEHVLCINTLNNHYTFSSHHLLLSLTSCHKELEKDAVALTKKTIRGVVMEESRIKFCWWDIIAKLNKLCLILIYILQFIHTYTATFRRTERDMHGQIRSFYQSKSLNPS